MQRTQKTPEVCCLGEADGTKTKEASYKALRSALELVMECHQISFSLEETQNLLEVIWYDLVPQEKE